MILLPNDDTEVHRDPMKLSTGKEVKIKELPIKKYAQLLRKLKDIPEILDSIDSDMSNDAFLSVLPEIISGSLPKFVEMLELTTPLKAEEINELGLNDVVLLTEGVIKANKFDEIAKKVKASGVLDRLTELGQQKSGLTTQSQDSPSTPAGEKKKSNKE